MHTLTVLICGSGPVAVELTRVLGEAGHDVATCADCARLAAVASAEPGADVSAAGRDVDWVIMADLDAPSPSSFVRQPHRGVVSLSSLSSASDHALERAIFRCATRHHVGWRVSGEEGGTLLVHEVGIGPEETAGTLARACEQAVAASLPDLVAALVAEDAPRNPLPETEDGAVGSWPPRGGIIDFRDDTATILRLVRSLDHGGRDGASALPKVLAHTACLLVRGACGADGGGQPGEILATEGRALVVATSDGAVRLDPVAGPFGESAPLPAAGTVLAAPDATEQPLDDASWGERFADWRPARWQITPGPGGAPWSRTIHLPPDADMAAVLTVFPALVSSMCGGAAVDFALAHDGAAGTLGWVPLRFDPAEGWAAAGEALMAEVARLSTVTPVRADLPARCPGARDGGMTLAALSLGGAVEGAALTLAFDAQGLVLHADPHVVAPAEAALVAERVRHLLDRLPGLDPAMAVADLPILPDAERDLVLHGWNATDAPFDADATIHGLIAARTARTPSARAVTAADRTLTYAALEREANRLAWILREAGAAPGAVIGLDLPQSADWIVAAVATLKTGAAFLTLGPGVSAEVDLVVVPKAGQARGEAPTVGLDDPRLAEAPDMAPPDEATGDDLAYLVAAWPDDETVVMVEHRNLTNLLVGLDERIATDCGVWLALGEPAVGHWIVETLGALVRGHEVVLGDADLLDPPPVPERRPLIVGLALSGPASTEAWDLAREVAAYGDHRDVSALWTVGEPGSVVLATAAAASTSVLPVRAQTDAGSIREVASLERFVPGRVGAILATSEVEPVAERVAEARHGGVPLWLAVEGDVQGWQTAAAHGCNVVLSPAGWTLPDLARRIAGYRAQLAAHGHEPDAHRVTLILPAYLDEDADLADAIAREPMEDFLRSGLGPEAGDARDAVNEWALLGTIEDAMERLERLAMAGADEVACVVDFGLPAEAALAGLVPLVELCGRMAAAARAEPHDPSLAGLIVRHGATHLHAAPGTVRRLLDHEPTRAALSGLRQVLLSGGPVPGDLVAELGSVTGAAVEVVQGWPETSVWACSQPARPDQATNGIGAPLANVQAYVLDAASRPCPVGVEGELWVGGAGIARGYWRRDDLTAERFKSDPFRQGGRLFRTGAQASWRADGTLDLRGMAARVLSPRPVGVSEEPHDADQTCRESVLMALESGD